MFWILTSIFWTISVSEKNRHVIITSFKFVNMNYDCQKMRYPVMKKINLKDRKWSKTSYCFYKLIISIPIHFITIMLTLRRLCIFCYFTSNTVKTKNLSITICKSKLVKDKKSRTLANFLNHSILAAQMAHNQTDIFWFGSIQTEPNAILIDYR